MNPLLPFIPDRKRLIEIVQQEAACCVSHLAATAATSWAPLMLVYARRRELQGPVPLGPEIVEGCLFACDWNIDSEKREAMRRLGRTYYDRAVLPTAACLITEVWRSHTKGIQPRDDPQREEGIVVVACACNTIEAVTAWIPTRRVRERMLPGPVEFDPDQKGQAPILSAFFASYVAAYREFQQRN